MNRICYFVHKELINISLVGKIGILLRKHSLQEAKAKRGGDKGRLFIYVLWTNIWGKKDAFNVFIEKYPYSNV